MYVDAVVRGAVRIASVPDALPLLLRRGDHRRMARASRRRTKARTSFFDKYVFGVKDFDEYLERRRRREEDRAPETRRAPRGADARAVAQREKGIARNIDGGNDRLHGKRAPHLGRLEAARGQHLGARRAPGSRCSPACSRRRRTPRACSSSSRRGASERRCRRSRSRSGTRAPSTRPSRPPACTTSCRSRRPATSISDFSERRSSTSTGTSTRPSSAITTIPKARLPGSGGANDVGSFARRTIIIIRQDKKRLVERCDFVTTPGYLDGEGARERAGLPKNTGPYRVITQLGVFDFDGKEQDDAAHRHASRRDGRRRRGRDLLRDRSRPEARDDRRPRRRKKSRFFTGRSTRLGIVLKK